MGKNKKTERVAIKSGDRVSPRGRKHMGSGKVIKVTSNGRWCHMDWDKARITTGLSRIHHVDELELT